MPNQNPVTTCFSITPRLANNVPSVLKSTAYRFYNRQKPAKLDATAGRKDRESALRHPVAGLTKAGDFISPLEQSPCHSGVGAALQVLAVPV